MTTAEQLFQRAERREDALYERVAPRCDDGTGRLRMQRKAERLYERMRASIDALYRRAYKLMDAET